MSDNFFGGFMDEIVKLGGYFSGPSMDKIKPLKGNTRQKSLYKAVPPKPAVVKTKVPRVRKGTRPMLTNIR